MANRSAIALGEIIRQQRELAELSMRQFAELAGISNPYLSQIERGLRAPSENVLDAIAGTLKVSADALYKQAGIAKPGTEGESSAVLDAIATDPRLTARQRTALREVYEAFVASSPRAARPHRPTNEAKRRTRPSRPTRPNRQTRSMSERRAALVTGAASGIGRAVATRLADDGYDVLAVDLAPDPDGPGVPFEADLVSPSANEAAVNAALEQFGRLDLVVPNAGVQHVAPVDEFPQERWDTIVALLLTSPFVLAKHSWPALKESGSGRFIVIASAHALVASPFKAAYVSAKHGVLGLVKTLALEGADAGVTTAAVCPGYVRTPLVEKQIADQARVHALSEDDVLEQVILAPHAVKRLIEPSEVADVVAFLAGPSGRAFTGVPVTMDQGWTAR